jgi:[ribosomal protein S18]-alanine N-acetyltransferase
VPPSSKFTVREFLPADLEQIWQIDQKCFEPGISYTHAELAWYVGREKAFALVAEDAGGGPGQQRKLAGFIIADRQRGSTGHIITIDVLPKARRCQLGSTLLTAAEKWLRDAGCSGVKLETAVNNTAAIAFYQRHGYTVVRTLHHYYPNGVDALRMMKALA